MSIQDKYKVINDSYKKRLSFRVGLNAGFFSEYNNMILAMLYCLDHKIKFYLYSSHANFDEKNGWSGFFERFCEEDMESIDNHYRTFNWRYAIKRLVLSSDKDALKSIYPYFNLWKKDLYTQDVFAKCRDVSLKRHYYIPQLDIDGDIRHACSQLIKLTWRYNQETQNKINFYLTGTNILSSPYIGIHLRSGDKYYEAKIFDFEIYIKKAVSLTEIREAFILTDDYRIFENLTERYPDWNFYTFCDINETGYYHEQFSQESTEIIRNKMIKLFASIEMLANSTLFIGTYSSNPGMYLGMRMPKEKVYAVDLPDWKIW